VSTTVGGHQSTLTNQELSEKRADAVMQFLISQGLKPDLVSAKGFGEADPVASNNSAQGRAQNRRVELSLAGSSS
jgi:chemotaxis protein MotB